jgi:predicted ATPase
LKRARYGPFDPYLTAELAAVLTAAGRPQEALAQIERFEASNENPQSWGLPELIRRKGQLLASADPDGAAALFGQSMAMARGQGALSWELRGAVDLGRLRHGEGRGGAARELLAATYGRFSEGFETPDLQEAKALLSAWDERAAH